MNRILCWVALWAVLAGCAHHYVYSGTLEAQDSQENDRQFLLYWNRTERLVWFDESEGSVRVLPQCSLNVMPYDERPEGIIFRVRESDKKVIEAEQDKNQCGKILNAKQVTDLAEGPLSLTVLCTDSPPDEFSRPKPYLKARPEPYEFIIARREVPDFSEIPKRPPCKGPN